MAIKNSIIRNLHFVVEVEKLRNIHVIVLHIISLTNVTHDAGVETLCLEFKGANSKGVTWLQVVILVLKEHPIEATAL